MKPDRLAADTAYGTGKFLGWLVGAGITPHIPVWDKGNRDDGTFSRSDFTFDKQKNEYTMPGRQGAADDRQGARRPHDPLSGEQARLRLLPLEVEVLPKRARAQSAARRARRGP